MKRALLAAVCVAAWAPGQECAVVEGERIRAGDLARLRPLFSALDPDMELGYAPAPGLRRVLAPGELARLARRHGLIAVSLEAVCIEGAAERLAEAGLIEAMRRSLGEEARIEIVEFVRHAVPRGVLEFPLAGLAGPPGQPGAAVLWRGRVWTASGRTAPVWARVRVGVERRGLVARRDLAAGKAIEAGDVEERLVELFPTVGVKPVEASEVVGAVARRRIRAGEMLTAALLRLAPEVERGDRVEVEVRTGAARLRLEARAETSGRRGEAVLVRNPATGRRFKAMVEGPGRLAVEIGEKGAVR